MKDSKEQLLMTVEGTATWRASLLERFPNDAHNVTASKHLRELHEYLETLPENHMIFYWYGKLMSDENEIIKVNEEIRSFGYQKSEEPKDFVERILVGLQS